MYKFIYVALVTNIVSIYGIRVHIGYEFDLYND
jgi:hypothetical protein